MASKCPNCGKPSIGVCLECYVDKYPFGLKRYELKVCKCGKILFRGVEHRNLKELVKEYVSQEIMPPPDISVKKVIVKKITEGKIISAETRVVGSYKGRDFKREKIFKIKPIYFACDACSKLAGGYYEAIIQIRVKGFKPDFQDDMIDNAEKVRGGLDYYIRSREYAKTWSYELRKTGFYVETSSKLFGKKDGRSIYRVTYSVKRPGFDVGDIVLIGDRLLLVRDIARDVKFTEIESGRKRSIKLNDLREVNSYATPKDFVKVLVTAIKPEGIQVMDLSSYETYDVPHKEGLCQGDNVSAVYHKKKLILI